MIEILEIRIITDDTSDGATIGRHADIVISDGPAAYRWAVGGLPVEGDIQAILDAREAELWIAAQVVATPVPPEDTARLDFRALPGWAAWTGQEAADFVHGDVLAGMDKAALEAWVDANVTTLATAKTALKLLGDELIDLREICENMARAVMYLRDITVR